MARSAIFREGVEVYRFSWVVSAGVPILALFLQWSLPLRLSFFTVFDLPLLATLYFAVARRNPIVGTAMGCAIGIAQDALTHQPLGVFGIAKSLVGYAASSIGVKVDVENPLSRVLMVFAFYLAHRAVYQQVGKNMAQLPLPWSWTHELGAALANALLAMVLFFFLDRLKQRR